MRTLVRKMEKLGLLKLRFILGTLVMAIAFIALPTFVALSIEPEFLTNPVVIAIVLSGMLFFGLVGFFSFVLPYILYRKAPEVMAEADDEFLYIHGKKEAKIPLNSLTEATVHYDLPFIYQKEFLREFIIHLFSDEYGTIILELAGYGSFKMRFVPQVKKTADELTRFIEGEMNPFHWEV